MTASEVRLGLTGGMGSGKSTVAAILQELGATVLDADAISRNLTAPHGAAISAIASAFGPDFIDDKGGLNRGKMRDTVFNEACAKRRLESILHPLIRHEMLVKANAASVQGAPAVVFDIPLLVESGTWRAYVDLVLVVDCTLQTQLMRVKARDSLSDGVIQMIISAQASRLDRTRAADIVLLNDDCSLEQLAISVRDIARKLGL